MCGLHVAADALPWVPASSFSPVRSDAGGSLWRRILLCVNYYDSLALLETVIYKADLLQPRPIVTAVAYCVP